MNLAKTLWDLSSGNYIQAGVQFASLLGSAAATAGQQLIPLVNAETAAALGNAALLTLAGTTYLFKGSVFTIRTSVEGLLKGWYALKKWSAKEEEFIDLWYVVPSVQWMKSPKYKAVPPPSVGAAAAGGGGGGVITTHVLRESGYDPHVQCYFCFDAGLLFGREARLRQKQATEAQKKGETLTVKSFLDVLEPRYVTLNAFTAGTDMNMIGGRRGFYTRVQFQPNFSTLPEYHYGFMMYLVPILDLLINDMNPRPTTTGSPYFPPYENSSNLQLAEKWTWLLEPRTSSKNRLNNKRKREEYDVFYAMELYTHNFFIPSKRKLKQNNLDRTPITVTKKLKLLGYVPKETTSVGFVDAVVDILEKKNWESLEKFKQNRLSSGEGGDDPTATTTGSLFNTVGVYHSKILEEEGGKLYDLSVPTTSTRDGRTPLHDNLKYFTSTWNGIFGTLTVVNVSEETKNKYRFNAEELASLATMVGNNSDVGGEGLSILQKKYPAFMGVCKSKYVTLSFSHDNKPEGLFASETIQKQGWKTLPESPNKPRFYVTHPSKSQVLVHVLRIATSKKATEELLMNAYYVSDVFLFVSKNMHGVTSTLMTSGSESLLTTNARNGFNNIRYNGSLKKNAANSDHEVALIPIRGKYHNNENENDHSSCMISHNDNDGDSHIGVFHERLKGWMADHQLLATTSGNGDITSTNLIGQKQPFQQTMRESGQVMAKYYGVTNSNTTNGICKTVASDMANDFCLKALTLGNTNKDYESVQSQPEYSGVIIGAIMSFLRRGNNKKKPVGQQQQDGGGGEEQEDEGAEAGGPLQKKKKGLFSRGISKIKRTASKVSKGVQKLKSGQPVNLGKYNIAIQKTPAALQTEKEKLQAKLAREAVKHKELQEKLVVNSQRKQEALQKKLSALEDKLLPKEEDKEDKKNDKQNDKEKEKEEKKKKGKEEK